MVQTMSQYKIMEKNKEKSTSSDLSQTTSEFNPREFINPPLNPPQLPQDPQEGGFQEEDVTNNFQEMSQDEILELVQNPKTHKLVNTVMRLNPTQYMLALAKEGAKLPSDFDVSTIFGKPFGNMPQTSFMSSFPSIIQPIIQPSVRVK